MFDSSNALVLKPGKAVVVQSCPMSFCTVATTTHISTFTTWMLLPHTSRTKQEDRNAEIYSLHRYTNWEYDKIGKATGVVKSTVRGIIKRGDECGGDLHDMPRQGGPTKITDVKRKKVESILDEDP